MRLFFTFPVLFSFVFFVCGQNTYDPTEVKTFRELRDKDLRNPQVSPLRPEDVAGFDGLKYFPVDAGYAVRATFARTPDEKSFMMPTSSGRTAKYLKIGVLSFTLNGQELTLGAFRREYENPDFKPVNDSLFVPFKDLTSGKETYGAGRYLYLRMPKERGAVVLDFNLAFNPGCAYGNESFSCTLPPKENFLKVEIKAGEKSYK